MKGLLMDQINETAAAEYGPSYYHKHCGPLPYDRSCPHWSIFFGGVAETLIRSFRPRRVFDAGCAHGFLVEAFWDRGVEAWGRDISEFAISEVRADLRCFCSVGSIADPINGRFDLITCIEVLEHMPEASAVKAIKAMAAATNRILFSSSPTDLEEPTHINVKPALWWLQVFAAEGFAPLMSFDPTFVTPHCVVLERVAEPPGDEILAGYSEIVRLRLQRAERDQIIRDAAAATQASEQNRNELIEENNRLRQEALNTSQSEEAARGELDRLRQDLERLYQELAQETARAAEAERRSRVQEQEFESTCCTISSAAQEDRLQDLAKIAALREALAHAEAEYRGILTSTSWQMSYPLRRVAQQTSPTLRRQLRGVAKVFWWTLTLQLRSRLRRRRAVAASIRQETRSDTDVLEDGQRAIASALEEDHIGQEDQEAAWYLLQNPDVAAAGMDAREHYRTSGQAEGRSWGLPAAADLARQANWYLLQNPEAAATGVDPLQHFLRHCLQEGRPWPGVAPTAAEIAADRLPWLRLLNVSVDSALADRPALNVLLPSLAMKNMSGGPNTAVTIACRLAATGIKVRLVSISAPHDGDPSAFWAHASSLSGDDPRLHEVELVDAFYRGKPFHVGVNDLFMATAWWTAQAAKYVVRHMRQKRFLYLIQDYESLLHPASTQQALAEETYHFDYLPIINTRLLQEFLTVNRIGRFATPEYASEALTFEPAIDTTLFFPVSADAMARRKRKRLLFYARPTQGLRNLFELGVAALRKLVNAGIIRSDRWEICGMGEAFEPISLGLNCWLEPLPWQDLTIYAQQMRESDVLLSLMLSPHPSYPPLEMAACGRPAVTTVFGNKDAARLAAISPNIIGVKPTLEGIAGGLLSAIRRGGVQSEVDLPASWSESLDAIMPRLRDELMRLQGAPCCAVPATDAAFLPGRIFPGFAHWPRDRYGLYRLQMLEDRTAMYTDADPGLLSFITPVWNTAPQFLAELAESVFGQDSGPGFEWVILDNGSTNIETRSLLTRIAKNPAVQLIKSDENLGIIAGTRLMLERAHNRYIVPLDHDDLLTADCARVMTSALRGAGFPLFAYSDEDKQLEGWPRDPYCKPDWDPVLFTHSCYIAHLCAIDRETALQLGCYTNPGTEGSPDWDCFTRFMIAGHTPLHVPELIYTWRMHPQSTAMDMGSKSYIHDSQINVLRGFLAGRNAADRYTVEFSPLFNGTPDWRFLRASEAARPLTTLLIGPGAHSATLKPEFTGHRIERLEHPDLAALLAHAHRAAAVGHYLHLLSAAVAIDDRRWVDEALTMFELYPETAMVGGRIHQNGLMIAADSYFGFDGCCGSPNVGRLLTDPGYFLQVLKPHAANAVPLQHCVIEPSFLVDVLPALIRAGVGTTHLSAWLGAAARMQDRRCIYSPFISAMSGQDIEPPAKVESAAFEIAYAALIPDPTLLSPRLGLNRQDFFEPRLRAERQAEEHSACTAPSLRYPDLHAAEVMARHLMARAPVADVADLSILTTIYIRTDPQLFRATAASLLDQSLPFGQWVILAHGPIASELEEILVELAGNGRVRILREPCNLGIIRGMSICLKAADRKFVAPMDADDLLTVDALHLITESLSRDGCADLVFSDEDILYEQELRSPVRRSEFDPILNDADSTIWHFCAFRRERALQLGVYSDVGSEACHDWDTIQRFSAAGAVIRHIPHVLYHWRHHPASVSGSGTTNEGSLRSVRHVLSRIIAHQTKAELYEVKPYPLFRGVEQFALLRRHVTPLPLCLLYFVSTNQTCHVPENILTALPIQESRVVAREGEFGKVDLNALSAALQGVTSDYLVVLNGGLQPSNDEGPWDAMRLFEMHHDVAAVGGRILDTEGRVVACCETSAGKQAQTGWIGRPSTDPGEFAMALKPQTATTLPEGYFFCRASMLRSVLAADQISGAQQIAPHIADVARQRAMRIAYSPLLEATYGRGGD
jgi:O-antigen biosynthesis protein